MCILDTRIHAAEQYYRAIRTGHLPNRFIQRYANIIGDHGEYSPDSCLYPMDGIMAGMMYPIVRHSRECYQTHLDQYGTRWIVQVNKLGFYQATA